MSSSQQCFDEDNGDVLDNLNAASLVESSESPPKTKTAVDFQPEMVLRNTKYVPSGNIYHCTPLINCSNCQPQREHFERGYDTFACGMHNSIPHTRNSPAEVKKVCSRRKERHTCKRKRYLSCPSLKNSFDFNSRLNTRELFSSFCDLRCSQGGCSHPSRYPIWYEPHETTSLSKDSVRKITQKPPNYGNGYTIRSKNSKFHSSVIPRRAYCSLSDENNNPNSLGFSASIPVLDDSPYRKNGFPCNIIYGNCNSSLCCSSPDIRREFRDTFMNIDHQYPLQNSNKLSEQSQKREFGSQPAVFDDTSLQDDVFHPNEELRCFPYSSKHSLREFEPNDENRYRVRIPKRQNSISIDNFEAPFPNMDTTYNKQRFQQSSTDRNSRNINSSHSRPPRPDSPLEKVKGGIRQLENVVRYLSHENISHSNGFISTAFTERISPSNGKTKSKYDEPSTRHTSPINNKREAQFERKIRIFSKFFANLGNLSKSLPDTASDSNYEITGDSEFREVISSHTRPKSLPTSTTLPPKKNSTSPPEFGRLLDFFRAMDSTKAANGTVNSSPSKDEHRIDESELPVYENRVSLQATRQYQQLPIFQPVVFTSSISMYINGNKNGNSKLIGKENEVSHSGVFRKDESSHLRVASENIKSSSFQMPFQVVSKEIEDLQLSIRRAKETRMSASKELHQLQELLSSDVVDDSKRFESPPLERHSSGKSDAEREKYHALMDLRENSKRNDSDDSSFWHEEIKRVKEETTKVWQAKLARMESRLTSQEEQLRRIQSDNESLQKSLEDQTLQTHTCRCKTECIHNGFSRIDSAFEDDEECPSHKLSIPIYSTRQDCERLQERLIQEEQRTGELNLLLNQKLIEINKLQLTLSKQTKEMIELEKNYLQLQCRLRRGTSKPVIERLCSRTSPFSSKNLCPKPSPPATPHPSSIS